jgi:asparagine synthase (glutamine-hydrolysing)
MHTAVTGAVRPTYLAAGSRHRSLHGALAVCSRLDLDYEAINCFLRTGFYLRGRTPFKQVRREWTRPPILTTRLLSRHQAIEQYVELFRRTIGRMSQRDAVIGLSGGADSRHILLELVRLGRPPDVAFTIDLPGIEDATVARQVAARLQVRHELLSPTDAPDDEVRKCLLVDFRSMQHRWFMAVADRIDRSAWWDGIGGDVLSAGLFLEPWNLALMQAGRFEEYAERLVSVGDVYWFGASVQLNREQAIHDVAEELALHAEAANPVGSFYFWNRTCVDIAAAPFGILASRGVDVLAPYLDAAVWEFLMSLPAHLLLDHRFHIDAISAAFPSMADVPYARKRPLPLHVQRFRGRTVLPMLSKRFVREPRVRVLKALVHAARAAVTGGGYPGGLLEALVYSDAVMTAVRRCSPPAASAATISQ